MDVSGMANSKLADSLQNRLHFDDIYQWTISKTITPMSAFSAWFDANVIDGIVKLVERTSVSGSMWIRTYTTGNTRDYILMAAVGALSIFVLIVGVSQ
jgi:NADH:ubiquinone oxidoreductase subunit 5 (subunit L)/multisubunit Na+/H+ antiporter MnhA subunit